MEIASNYLMAIAASHIAPGQYQESEGHLQHHSSHGRHGELIHDGRGAEVLAEGLARGDSGGPDGVGHPHHADGGADDEVSGPSERAGPGLDPWTPSCSSWKEEAQTLGGSGSRRFRWSLWLEWRSGVGLVGEAWAYGGNRGGVVGLCGGSKRAFAVQLSCDLPFCLLSLREKFHIVICWQHSRILAYCAGVIKIIFLENVRMV